MENIIDTLRGIRKEFFAYRNGIVAERLRAAGDPHSMIMGCLLADIVAIAQRYRAEITDNDTRAAVAEALWDDTRSRECRLAAPMIFPAEIMPLETALQWCTTVESVEVADNLCHKLLRRLPDGERLFQALIACEEPMAKYTGFRLLNNLLMLGKVQATPALRATVEDNLNSAQPPLAALLRDILEELGA